MNYNKQLILLKSIPKSEEEKQELVTNCDRLDRLKHSSALPRVFTEQGVTTLKLTFAKHERGWGNAGGDRVKNRSI